MRNVWILAAAQAFGACGTIMLVTFGGIVGTRIAPTAALATLPLIVIAYGVSSDTIFKGHLLAIIIGGWIGWYFGAWAGLVAGFITSAIGSGVGLYLARRFAQEYLE